MINLRKLTFLSINLPSGWNGLYDDNLAFEAPGFHTFMATTSQIVPRTLRHVRYQHLIPKGLYGVRQTYLSNFCCQEPENARRWIKVDTLEGEKMFCEDLTPRIV